MKSSTTSKRVANAQRQVAAVGLDDLLDPERAVAWTGIPEKELLEKNRKKQVTLFFIGPKTWRIHPRTFLADQANKSGVPLDVISASFGSQHFIKNEIHVNQLVATPNSQLEVPLNPNGDRHQ